MCMFVCLFLGLAKGSQTVHGNHVKFASVVALTFLRSVSIFLTFYVLSFQSHAYFNSWIEALSKTMAADISAAKYRFLEVGPNKLIRRIWNVTASSDLHLLSLYDKHIHFDSLDSSKHLGGSLKSTISILWYKPFCYMHTTINRLK